MSEVRVSLPLEQAEAILALLETTKQTADLLKTTALFGYKTEGFLNNREKIVSTAELVIQQTSILHGFLSSQIKEAKHV